MTTDSKAEPIVEEAEGFTIKSSALGLVTRIDRDELRLGKWFRITPIGLTISGKPDYDQCSDLGEALRVVEHAAQFSVGDFVNYVEDAFGEQASQIVDASNWSESTLKVYRWVCKQVPMTVRLPELSFSHHQVVADLSPEDQQSWLLRASDGEDGHAWSVGRLRKQIKLAKAGKQAEPKWYLLVDCGSEEKRGELMRQLDNLGFSQYKQVGGVKVKGRAKKPKREVTAMGKASKRRQPKN